jgi:multimeric flavodoxin WrbA
MKIIGIVCSPRKDGNTEILVREALRGAQEREATIELLKLYELNIAPCDGCQLCKKWGECKIKDDMQQVYKKLLSADGIIIGSPVYFWSVSAQAKIFMDRTYALRYPDHKLRGKIAGAIVVGSHKGHTMALSTLNCFFLHHEMIVAGLGVAGYAFEAGDIKKDERALRESKELGKRICELNKRGSIPYIHPF